MQFVENLYFIAFVVAFAAVVVVLIMRSSTDRSRREARRSLRARKRRLDSHRHRLAMHPTAHYGDPWRRSAARVPERSHRPVDSRGSAPREVPFVQAQSFTAVKPATDSLQDQDISPAEHLSISEYLTKAEREKAREEADSAAQAEDGMTMKAIKYELVDEADEPASKEGRRQGGFKP